MRGLAGFRGLEEPEVLGGRGRFYEKREHRKGGVGHFWPLSPGLRVMRACTENPKFVRGGDHENPGFVWGVVASRSGVCAKGRGVGDGWKARGWR